MGVFRVIWQVAQTRASTITELAVAHPVVLVAGLVVQHEHTGAWRSSAASVRAGTQSIQPKIFPGRLSASAVAG
jgi:hypothetical protein